MNEPKPLSKDLALRIVAALCAAVGLLRVTKTGGVWTALGLIFDALKFIGFAVPSGAQVVGEYAQTLPVTPGLATPFSAVALMPDRELSPDGLVELVGHEGTHSQQSRDDAAWGVKYLKHREYRMGAEGPAFAFALGWKWVRTGKLPATLDDFVHVARGAYDAKEHAELMADVIEIYGTEISFGILRNPLLRLAVAMAYRDEPECIHPAALALIQANDPGALVMA